MGSSSFCNSTAAILSNGISSDLDAVVLAIYMHCHTN